jgi:2-methylisocitrate lyase-like PEP mutase family enzyme
LEDSDHAAKTLVDAELQAERISAIRTVARAEGVDVVINARIDVHLYRMPHAEGIRRARLYVKAGADCVYPILLSHLAALSEYVAVGPTNVLWRPGGPRLTDLASVGVSRISVGPLMYQQMLRQLSASVHAMRDLDDEHVCAK